MHPTIFFIPQRLERRIAVGVLAGSLALLPVLSSGQEKTKDTEREKQVKITEEILVVGKSPKVQPISTVTTLGTAQLERKKPVDLSEIIRYAPGVIVSYGNKYEFTLKLRGMNSQRIALLIDGVPSYEPYYGSFDLKTISAAGLDSIQITKGPSSVLYGPNTLAGIVNVITRRPGDAPALSLTGSMGARNTNSAGLDGGARWDRFSLAGSLSYQKSDGFGYPDPAGTSKTVDWMNTDYRRFNLTTKLEYAPSNDTQIMLDGGIYTSAYGMPAAVNFGKARYWHFKDWDRYTLSAGGFTSLGDNSTLRFRAFFVNYQNTLDTYKDKTMSILQTESTYNNSVYGVFALADFGLASWNSLKLSFNFQEDVARTQDNAGLPFVRYNEGTFSAAAEDHIALADQWKLIGGLSLDVIDKYTGGTASRINPLLGLKFTPSDEFDVHVSLSQKSRLPNMRALYSPSNGNPDLLSETGTNAELGFTWSGPVYISGAAFLTQFKNMIDTMTLPDGSRKYWNVGKARINGFEIQTAKTLGWIDATVNYTYLDHQNEVDHRPLDALSPHSLSFDVSIRPLGSLRLGVYGLYGSKSTWFDSTSGKVLDIPSYFNVDANISYDWSLVQVFIKATNLFNTYVYTEPIYPWRARFFEFGAKVKVF